VEGAKLPPSSKPKESSLLWEMPDVVAGVDDDVRPG
jgi:hypothetical protein